MSFCFGDPDMQYRPKGNEWTEDEVAQLRLYAQSGMSHAEAAEKLGRSLKSVQLKCYRLGIRWSKTWTFWTNAEVSQLRQCARSGMTLAEAAALLNRPFRGVQSKASILKISFMKRGEHHYNCKVSKEQIKEIFQLRADGVTCRKIGTMYGINAHTVSEITRFVHRYRDALAVVNELSL